MKSIEERLTDARHAIALIIAGLSVDDLPIGEGRLHDAIYDAALRAHEEVHWLCELPAEILKVDAPDQDEREGAEQDTEAGADDE